MMAPFSPTSRKEREGNDDSDADGHRGQMMNFSAAGEFDGALLDFCDRDLLDCIDFDDFFVDDALQLPHLEIDDDPEMVLTEWTACTSEGDEAEASVAMEKADGVSEGNRADGGAYCSGSGSGSDSDAGCGEERDNEKIQSDGSGEYDVKIRGGGVYKRKKSEAQRKITSQAKRKHKVDWTPDLHKRFVQAVDQLGVEKAVPSKILELMAIDSLTRHNIASHLQKYRSRRKHSVAREAKAMNWTQQRHQMYGGAAIAGGSKRVMIPWSPPAPAVGFPPMAPTNHFIRPLHVWGHPTSSTEQLVMHAWLEHPPPSTWTHPAPVHHLLSPPPLLPLLLPPDPSYWHQHRFKVAAPVQGIPHQEMHKLADPGPTMGVPAAQPLVDSSQPPFDLHLSKESIDAAVGEALSEPWKPLPLGLKPPSLDSVLLELQRQGIPSIPPPSTTSIT